MKWDSSLECVCLRVWEEGVEDVYLQLSPFWRAGANQCSLSLFKSQWESFLALVLLLFHLTFKLYLLGKPGISETKQFGRVWVKVKTPSLSCDISWTGALAGFADQRFAALRCLLRPQDAAASQGSPHWWFPWAAFVQSSLIFLCSPQSGELGCDIADISPTSACARGPQPKAFVHVPCTPQDLHHQDWSHPGNLPHCVPSTTPHTPTFLLQSLVLPFLRWFIWGSTMVSLCFYLSQASLWSTGNRKLKKKSYIYILKRGAGPVSAEQLKLPGATCEQDQSPGWWAWHSHAEFKGFLGGESEVSCEALTSALFLSQVIPFEWSFGAKYYFWELRLLKISPSICVAGVYSGIKLISLCWSMCQEGHSGGVKLLECLGVRISQTVSFC